VAVSGTDVGTVVGGKVVAVTEGGHLMHGVDLTEFDDGRLEIAAYATSEGGVKSEKTEVIEIMKDTAGPQINKDELSFVIGPSTDAPYALMSVPKGDYEKLSIEQTGVDLAFAASPLPAYVGFEVGHEPVALKAFDKIDNQGLVDNIDLLPAFFTDRGVNYEAKAQQVNRTARYLVMVVGLILLVMLLLAILVKIRIQHPQMITNASLVILLALVLLFV
jgi:hypothetical protein